jgi:GNAT superfamily N-acetyltransferase
MSVTASTPAVRLARRDDRPAILRLIVDAYQEFEPSLTPANWALMMTNLERVILSAGKGNLLVADSCGRLAGTVTYYPPGPKDYNRVPAEWAVIRALAVHPACRRGGVGRLLTEECLRRARADQAGWAGLHTSELMVGARTMYEAMGFREQHTFTHLDISFSVYALALEVPPAVA